ncbi:MAG: ABC transporter permease subunit [Nitrososphaerota archaeon]
MRSTVLLLLKRDLSGSLRSRWLLGFVASFAAMGASFAYLGALGLGQVGFRAYSAAVAGIINLNLYVVPLAAVVASSLSLVAERERGTMEFLLSLPLARWELVLSRLCAGVLSLAAAIAMGYGLASWALWLLLSEADLWVYLSMLGASVLLAFSFSGIGTLISSLTRSRFAALALALGVWIGLVMVYEVALMAAVILLGLDAPTVIALMVLNPVQASRLMMVHSVDPTLSFLGEFGVLLVRELGGLLVPLLVASQLAVGLACTALALLAFGRSEL